MPYKVFTIDGQKCVFKVDGDGNKTGDSLGCHETMGEANDQMAAIMAEEGSTMNREEKAKSLFDKFLEFSKALFIDSKDLFTEQPDSPPVDRAISMSRLHGSIWNQLMDRDRRFGEDNYMMDIYADEGALYALCTDRGKLYRHPLTVSGDDVTLGERVQVMESHPAVTTRTVIRQQADGRWRWFSVSGTAVLNRSGEIDSRELFDNFIRHAEETGIYPIRMFYHQGQVSRDGKPDEQAQLFRTGQADFLARDDYCYVTSGLFDDTPLAQAEVQARQANPNFWGDSIGFWPWDMSRPYELTEIANGISIPMYRDGINVEITTLPEAEASHLFTRMEVTRMSIQGKAWEAFVALWGGVMKRRPANGSNKIPRPVTGPLKRRE